jgi:hypothetical protein
LPKRSSLAGGAHNGTSGKIFFFSSTMDSFFFFDSASIRFDSIRTTKKRKG